MAGTTKASPSEPGRPGSTVDDPSSLLAERLLQGWTMLAENCPACSSVPLMRDRKGRDFCVACNAFLATPNEPGTCLKGSHLSAAIHLSDSDSTAIQSTENSLSDSESMKNSTGLLSNQSTESSQLSTELVEWGRGVLSRTVHGAGSSGKNNPLNAPVKQEAKKPSTSGNPGAGTSPSQDNPKTQVLKTTEAQLLRNIARYTSILQSQESSPPLTDCSVLSALREALAALAILVPLTH